MAHDRVDDLLHEHELLRDRHEDPQLEAVKTAVFLEDVFGVTLSDAEIEPDLLGTPAAIRSLLARKLGRD